MRVCLVSLQGDGKFEITQTKYRLTEEQKQEDGEKLFDFCAECLQTFIETNMANVTEPGLEPADGAAPAAATGEGLIKPGQELPLGFTVRSTYFCYPITKLIIRSSHTPASELASLSNRIALADAVVLQPRPHRPWSAHPMDKRFRLTQH